MQRAPAGRASPWLPAGTSQVWDASIVLAKYIEKVAGGAGAAGRGAPPRPQAAALPHMRPLLASRRRAPLPARRRCRPPADHPRRRRRATAAAAQNSRRGDFSRPKVRGKRVLELGAGMGLAGMAMALLGAGEATVECTSPSRGTLVAALLGGSPAASGAPPRVCARAPRQGPRIAAPTHARWITGAHPPPDCPADVAFTDIGDVLPLLQRNIDQNISPAALKRAWVGAAGLGGSHTGAARSARQWAWRLHAWRPLRHQAAVQLPPAQAAGSLRALCPPRAVKDAAWAAAEVGAASVAHLDWADRGCYAAFSPPYDFILAADCVYSELAGALGACGEPPALRGAGCSRRQPGCGYSELAGAPQGAV